MNTYNKNSSNQSGIITDNINVKNQASLPNINIDQSNLTFSNKIIANAGIQLPSSIYSITENMLGYQATSTTTIFTNRVIIPNGIDNFVASINLNPGKYLISGQIETFAYISTQFSYSSISISTTYNENQYICNSVCHNNNLFLNVGNNMIQDISRVIDVTTPTIYSLISYVTASTSGLIIKTTNLTASAQSIASSQTGVNISIKTTNSNIKIGMNVTGTGIVQPCYVSNNVNTTITLTTSQTIAANTNLSFAISNCKTSFSATRIA